MENELILTGDLPLKMMETQNRKALIEAFEKEKREGFSCAKDSKVEVRQQADGTFTFREAKSSSFSEIIENLKRDLEILNPGIENPPNTWKWSMKEFSTNKEWNAFYEGEIFGKLQILVWIRDVFSTIDFSNPEDALQKFNDLKKAFEHLHEMWNDSRRTIADFKIQLMQKRLKDISDTDKKTFIAIIQQARRTNEGKLIYSDVSRKAKKELPNGIGGRQLDDKYCKELVEDILHLK
ncbi:MAG: hypothetical protein ABR936_05225 [Bacteroidota bacterium]|jgi:hypothetical protein